MTNNATNSKSGKKPEGYRQEVAAMMARRAVAMEPFKALKAGDTGTVSIVEVGGNRALAHLYQRRFVVAAASLDFLTLAYEDRNGVEARTVIRRTDANRRMNNGGNWLRFRFDGLVTPDDAERKARAAMAAEAAAKAMREAKPRVPRKPQTDEYSARQRANGQAWRAANKEHLRAYRQAWRAQRAVKLAAAA